MPEPAALAHLASSTHAAARMLTRFAVELGYLAQMTHLQHELYRKRIRGEPLTPRERLVARRYTIRARGWRHRQLTRVDDYQPPVEHLVKPSAIRAGRRTHRRGRR